MGKTLKLDFTLSFAWTVMRWSHGTNEGKRGGAALGEREGAFEGWGEWGLIYVWASNAVSGMHYPLRLCVLASWEVECKWSRLLGEVGYSHGPMLGPAYAVAKQVFFVIWGPWGWAKQILSSAALLLKQKYSSLQTLFIRWKTLLRERYK